ncbi:serine O-acetyltransferase EpsC [Pseudoduganella umbonata]|uniref:serine O-acetyltransferase n=1 Tax=Pseudoduganella umbonata TaxID=864828 RepID=A0A4P8HQB6_9BURK|nr:serine O-acetyltransferase EpsC [Pseudoduganella umbonata]MBB3221507.1 serine O-acetyltransferase [Pseudoduganella umbonata]QCP10654.1 serine acetyltransferase [Pseudoduganella umbonata]
MTIDTFDGTGVKPVHWDLDAVVSALRVSREATHNIRHQRRVRELPSREALTTIVNGLSAVLFPTHYGRPNLTDESIDYFVGDTLNTTLNRLTEQVRRGLQFADDADLAEETLTQKAHDITRAFAASLPQIRGLLVSDVQAAYAGDPAATSIAEIMLCYPGTIAILYYRLAHQLHRLGSPFLARMICDISHSLTGVDIHPGAQIGASFFIDHGTGVVIGETAILGERVRLYQHVTLGAKRFPADASGMLIKGTPRHPIVEDDVVIYAGATVLGRITIGAGSTIGGNVWLTQSVPPHSNVSQAQTRSD